MMVLFINEYYVTYPFLFSRCINCFSFLYCDFVPFVQDGAVNGQLTHFDDHVCLRDVNLYITSFLIDFFALSGLLKIIITSQQDLLSSALRR